MTKETFYMQLCYVLLNKFCNGHVEITGAEWDESVRPDLVIKHRLNKETGNVEVMATVAEEIN